MTGGAWNNQLNLVFTYELGYHLYTQTVLKNFKKIVASIGIPETRFHDLRHIYATLSLQNGDDIKMVSEVLGHATVAFILDVYGHVTQQMKKASAERMNAYIISIR
jgi:integrase